MIIVLVASLSGFNSKPNNLKEYNGYRVTKLVNPTPQGWSLNIDNGTVIEEIRDKVLLYSAASVLNLKKIFSDMEGNIKIKNTIMDKIVYFFAFKFLVLNT